MGRKTGESRGPGPAAAVPWEVGAADRARAQHPLPTHPLRSAPLQGAPAGPAGLWEQFALHLSVHLQDQTEKVLFKKFLNFILEFRWSARLS